LRGPGARIQRGGDCIRPLTIGSKRHKCYSRVKKKVSIELDIPISVGKELGARCGVYVFVCWLTHNP